MPDRLWPALWTHLDVPGVEPTDNVAERAFRPAVLRRNGSLCTQSGRGAGFAGAMLTAGVCTASKAGHFGLAVPQLLAVTALPQSALRLPRTWPDQSKVGRSQLTPVNGCDRPGCRGWVRNPGGTKPSGLFIRTFTRPWLRSGARTRPAPQAWTSWRIPGARTLARDLTP